MSKMSEAHIEQQDLHASDGYMEWCEEQEKLADAWQLVIDDLRAYPIKMQILNDELGVDYGR